ncbi:MAG: hypothetical protein ACRD2C_24665 [Acidimicrobiales bacterium]
MITTGTKWFFGLGIVTLTLAAVYGWTTGGNGLGPVTVGYNGGVGDHFGYGVLVAAGVVSLFQGTVLTAWRDADPQAEAEVARLAVVPAVRPAGVSYWPAIAAFGAALVVVGLATEPILFVVGLIVLGIVLAEWTVQTWADHATGDPATNARLRNRLMNPIEFPAAGALAVGIVVVSVSRVLLAVSELGAVWVAGAVAVIVLAAGAMVASRPRLSSNVVVALLLVAAIVVIGLGVAGGVAGEREFHPFGTEPADEREHEGAMPAERGEPVNDTSVLEVSP